MAFGPERWPSGSEELPAFRALLLGVCLAVAACGGRLAPLPPGASLRRLGIAASIGSIGDAYDNALAETTIGLYKTEAVGRNSPFLTGPLKTIDDVEYATMEWVDWYNARRLHSLLDYVPPDEYESAYCAQPRDV